MQLFFNPDLTEHDNTATFPKDESRHIVKVLRKRTGDTLMITNGSGWIFESKIIDANQKACTISIIKTTHQPKRPYKLHLAVAPTKMNDRYEWFLEKATEIGIDEITPIICEHSERKTVKTERFERILQSAMKQSLSCYLPKLNAPIPFSEFIANKMEGQLFVAHCEDTNKASLKQTIKPQLPTTILIGPEGDFSVKEIETALANDFIPVTLGETRLRTETAAIVACHSVAFVNEK